MKRIKQGCKIAPSQRRQCKYSTNIDLFFLNTLFKNMYSLKDMEDNKQEQHKKVFIIILMLYLGILFFRQLNQL